MYYILYINNIGGITCRDAYYISNKIKGIQLRKKYVINYINVVSKYSGK